MQILKNSLISFILMVSLNSFGQYKNMNIGFYNNINAPSNVSSYGNFGVNFQYNFKTVFSLCSGASFEHRHYDELKSSTNKLETGPYSYRVDRFDVNAKFINVPLLLKATFGEKIHFYLNLGVNSSFSLKSNFSNETVYDLNYNNPLLNTGEMISSKKTELGFLYGFGMSTTILKRFLIFSEARFITSISSDKIPLYIDVNRYYGNTVVAGMAYQFNFSENSEYKFSSYKLGKQ